MEDAVAFSEGVYVRRYDCATVVVHVPRDMMLSEIMRPLERMAKEMMKHDQNESGAR